jgi:aspartate aminotransferase
LSNAFGADKSSSWYRLSVGTCRKEDLAPMFEKLEVALAQLQ